MASPFLLVSPHLVARPHPGLGQHRGHYIDAHAADPGYVGVPDVGQRTLGGRGQLADVNRAGSRRWVELCDGR